MIPKQVGLMAAQGCRLVPIGPGTKYPPFDEWPERATCDLAVLEPWWGQHPEWGLGWVMGDQGDGRFLFAIDVDVDKGGKQAFEALVKRYGLADEIRTAVTAHTGGGGYHFVIELPSDPVVVPITRSKLVAGVDVRSAGGQIVVEPSVHPVTGRTYGWVAGKAPWELRPGVASAGMMAMLADLLAPPVVPAPVGVAANGHRDEYGPADWVRDHLDFSTYLVKYGWSPLGGESWKRPGKTDRGSSAQLKNDGRGPLNVFTTDIPPELERLGHPDGTGQCLSFSLFELIAGYEFGGDESACGRWMWSTYMRVDPLPRASVGVDWEAANWQPAAPVVTTVPLVPEWVWSEREVLAQIAQAARAVGKSPAGLWLTMWLQWLTAIPTSALIPDFLGYHGTFDLLGCVVSRSGAGKTTLEGMARRLVDVSNPVTGEANPRLWIGAPDPTGEGLMEAFLYRQKGRKAERAFDGIHFVMDEGTVFIQGSHRDGATIIGNLCKAWSGSLTGTTTASAERKRWFDPQSIRVTVLVSMQVEHGHLMLDKNMSDTGLAQRMIFAHAVDPGRIPVADRPARIIEPIMRMPRTLYTPNYSQAIIDEITEDDHNSDDLDPLDTHRNLNTLKIAWPFAALEKRATVNEDDWRLAKTLMTYSHQVRSLLLDAREISERDARLRGAEKRAEADIHYEDTKAKGRLTARAQRLQRHLTKHGERGESDAIRGTFGSNERHDAEDVVRWGIEIGLFERRGDRLVAR